MLFRATVDGRTHAMTDKQGQIVITKAQPVHSMAQVIQKVLMPNTKQMKKRRLYKKVLKVFVTL